MAVVQKFNHLLSVNGMAAGSLDPNFPGLCPTAASPCPEWIGSNKHVQGIIPATASDIAAFPAALTRIYIDYANANQRFTGTVLVDTATDTVVTGWA